MKQYFSFSRISLTVATVVAFVTALVASESLQLAPFGMAANEFEPALLAFIAGVAVTWFGGEEV